MPFLEPLDFRYSGLFYSKLEELADSLQSNKYSSYEDLFSDFSIYFDEANEGWFKPYLEPWDIEYAEYPHASQFQKRFEQIKKDLNVLYKEETLLGKFLKDNFNSIAAEETNLRKKLSAANSIFQDLQLFKGLFVDQHYFFTDTFSSTSNLELNSDLLKYPQATIVEEEGSVVLSYSKDDVERYTIKKFLVNPESNGSFTDSTHADLRSAFDGDPDTWVEYGLISAKESSPLVLSLSLFLEEEKVLNRLRISINNLGSENWPRIKDILITKDGSDFSSIKSELIDTDLSGNPKSDLLSPEVGKFSGEAVFTFFPRMVKGIKIVFEQSSPSILGNNLKYSFGLREVYLEGIKFQPKAQLVSKGFPLGSNLAKIALLSNESPVGFSSLGTITHEVSFDDGFSWKGLAPLDSENPRPELQSSQSEQGDPIPQIEPSKILNIGTDTDTNPTSIRYRATLERLQPAFDGVLPTKLEKIRAVKSFENIGQGTLKLDDPKAKDPVLSIPLIPTDSGRLLLGTIPQDTGDKYVEIDIDLIYTLFGSQVYELSGDPPTSSFWGSVLRVYVNELLYNYVETFTDPGNELTSTLPEFRIEGLKLIFGDGREWLDSWNATERANALRFGGKAPPKNGKVTLKILPNISFSSKVTIEHGQPYLDSKYPLPLDKEMVKVYVLNSGDTTVSDRVGTTPPAFTNSIRIPIPTGVTEVDLSGIPEKVLAALGGEATLDNVAATISLVMATKGSVNRLIERAYVNNDIEWEENSTVGYSATQDSPYEYINLLIGNVKNGVYSAGENQNTITPADALDTDIFFAFKPKRISSLTIDYQSGNLVSQLPTSLLFHKVTSGGVDYLPSDCKAFVEISFQKIQTLPIDKWDFDFSTPNKIGRRIKLNKEIITTTLREATFTRNSSNHRILSSNLGSSVILHSLLGTDAATQPYLKSKLEFIDGTTEFVNNGVLGIKGFYSINGSSIYLSNDFSDNDTYTLSCNTTQIWARPSHLAINLLSSSGQDPLGYGLFKFEDGQISISPDKREKFETILNLISKGQTENAKRVPRVIVNYETEISEGVDLRILEPYFTPVLRDIAIITKDKNSVGLAADALAGLELESEIA